MPLPTVRIEKMVPQRPSQTGVRFKVEDTQNQHLNKLPGYVWRLSHRVWRLPEKLTLSERYLHPLKHPAEIIDESEAPFIHQKELLKQRKRNEENLEVLKGYARFLPGRRDAGRTDYTFMADFRNDKGQKQMGEINKNTYYKNRLL